MYEVYACVCAHECSTYGGQKGAEAPLKLELQAILCRWMSVGTRTLTL